VILALAKGLELAVVAEGIETREHRDLLNTMGCARGQGSLFAKPRRAVEICLTPLVRTG
jgi:EAL domain-containing protein (putative c-di-GMP-specific phosphodiesterase class I)